MNGVRQVQTSDTMSRQNHPKIQTTDKLKIKNLPRFDYKNQSIKILTHLFIIWQVKQEVDEALILILESEDSVGISWINVGTRKTKACDFVAC